MRRLNALWAAAGIVIALFVVATAVLLYRGISQFSSEENKLKRSMSRLNGYFAEDPFPSEANMAQERTNVVTLASWFTDILKAMRKGQVEVETKSPTTFMNLLGERLNELNARGAGMVAPGFAYGFARYSETQVPPAPDDVPRLSQQLAIIDNLCRILFDARVKALTAVLREEFEDAASAAGRADQAAAGIVAPDALYGKFRFAFEFKANERSLMDIVNRLAAHPMFTVVTSLRVEPDGPDILPATEKPAAPPTGEETDGAVQEVVVQTPICGPEVESPRRIKMEVDVYRFRSD